MKAALLIGLSAWSLSACQSTAVAGFPECVNQLKRSAWSEARIPEKTFDRLAQGVSYIAALAEPGPTPPEFSNPTWEYAGFLVDDQKVAQGRQVMAQWQDALRHIESQTGVDPATVVAFFGVETDFGRFNGPHPVIPTLINRSCGPVTTTPTAKAAARRQLYAAMQIVELGDVQLDEFKGSYAGAFGHTQFIPGTYLEHRGGTDGKPLADGDRDGKVDVMHSIPDALMLTALKVKADGWTPGLPWALAVTLPADFDPQLTLREKAFGGTLHSRVASSLLAANRHSLADWQSLGVRVTEAAPGTAPDDTPAVDSTADTGLAATELQASSPAVSFPVASAALAASTDGAASAPSTAQPAAPPATAPNAYPALTPQTPFALISLNDDAPGPYILASSNFEAHYRYNYSINYAYAVGLLADRLSGRPAPPVRWKSDDRGLSRAEIQELQCRLTASHPELRADGVPGSKTRLAIVDEENRLGRTATGRTTFSLLRQMRGEDRPAQPCEPGSKR